VVNGSIPLAMASPGKGLTVTGIKAGWGLQRRLADMGLTPGTPIMVVNGCHSGPLLIDIRGSRLGLGFGVAQKVMVKEADNAKGTNCGCPGRQSQLG
jgi:Fe2+ transport system protein FeoA